MFKNAKEGDKVWDFVYGYGEITFIGIKTNYPLLISFNNTQVKDISYTVDGRCSDMAYQTLFWQEFGIPKEAYQKPLPKLEVDTKVYVWDCDIVKFKRHFSHFTEDGKIACFKMGQSCWSNNEETDYEIWDKWEIL